MFIYNAKLISQILVDSRLEGFISRWTTEHKQFSLKYLGDEKKSIHAVEDLGK